MENITVADIKKEFIKAKKDKNKYLSNAYMMLIDTAQKIAKETNEELNIKHFEKASKKLLKMVEDTLKNKGVIPEVEIKLYEKFLPKMKSKEETEDIIKKFVNENSPKNIGQVMGYLKTIDGIDMKLAFEICKKYN